MSLLSIFGSLHFIMRFDERQLISLSSNAADYEGRLHYKKIFSNCQNSKGTFLRFLRVPNFHFINFHVSKLFVLGFKERWFKLKYNVLFFFKLNDTRQLSLKQVFVCLFFVCESVSTLVKAPTRIKIKLIPLKLIKSVLCHLEIFRPRVSHNILYPNRYLVYQEVAKNGYA